MKKDILSKTKKLGYPVIVKPATLGSSIGISVVNTVEEMDYVIDRTKIAVERFRRLGSFR
mgnify:CR=1 FL=1